MPSEVLTLGGAANCLDGAVLFASLLELAGIDPLLVLIPGHAFVGWRAWEGEEDYEFVETTLLNSENFDVAQAEAQQLYDEAFAKDWFTRSWFDPSGFARIVDVVACHNRGIHPLE